MAPSTRLTTRESNDTDALHQQLVDELADIGSDIRDKRSHQASLRRRLYQLTDGVITRDVTETRRQFIDFFYLDNDNICLTKKEKIIFGTCFGCLKSVSSNQTLDNDDEKISHCCTQSMCENSFFMCTTCAKKFNQVKTVNCPCGSECNFMNLACPICSYYIFVSFCESEVGEDLQFMIIQSSCRHNLFMYTNSIHEILKKKLSEVVHVI